MNVTSERARAADGWAKELGMARMYIALEASLRARDKTVHARARKPEGHDICVVMRGLTGPGSAT